MAQKASDDKSYQTKPKVIRKLNQNKMNYTQQNLKRDSELKLPYVTSTRVGGRDGCGGKRSQVQLSNV